MKTEAIRAKFCHQYSTANKMDYKIVAKICKAIDKGLETDQMPSLMARPLVYTSIPFAYQSYQQAVKDMADEIAELKKERDDLKQELTTIKSMANICSGEIDDLELTMHQICTIASEALSTQGGRDE